MNIKNLRKNYALLSKRERFSLYEKALFRCDASEADAILAASPKTQWQVTDFYFLKEKSFQLNMLNLLERMKYFSYLQLSLDSCLETKDVCQFEKLFECCLINGYLYRIETDAWEIAGNEFGIDVKGFRQIIAKDNLIFSQMEHLNDFIKSLSFTDEGAQKVFLSRNINEVKPTDLKTLESQTKFYQQILSRL